MELYKLDSLLRRTEVIDKFESMIWSERFFEWGDFELQVFYTPTLRRLLPIGTLMAMSDSNRVMRIDLVEQKYNDDGSEILKFSGNSIESIMESRSSREFTDALVDMPYDYYGNVSPVTIVERLFMDVCQYNEIRPEDHIPFIAPGSLYPPSTIPNPPGIEINIPVGTLYDAISQISQAYRIGFRLTRHDDRSRLFFDSYTGDDRTTTQTLNDPVVFSKKLENLKNSSRVTSDGNYKNFAYVYHPFAFQIARLPGVPASTSGFARKILTLDASDVKVEELEYTFTADEKTSYDELVKKGGGGTSEAFRKFGQREWLSKKERTAVYNYVNLSSPGVHTATQIQRMNNVLAKYDAAIEVKLPILKKALHQRGLEELAKNRRVSAFDGEVNASSDYVYDLHYRLGDIVEFQNEDGITEPMRVIEQIFVSDGEGERMYPTLEYEDPTQIIV